jgi:hypothetical protein
LGFSCGAALSAFFSSFCFSATVTSGCPDLLVYHDSRCKYDKLSRRLAQNDRYSE